MVYRHRLLYRNIPKFCDIMTPFEKLPMQAISSNVLAGLLCNLFLVPLCQGTGDWSRMSCSERLRPLCFHNDSRTISIQAIVENWEWMQCVVVHCNNMFKKPGSIPIHGAWTGTLELFWEHLVGLKSYVDDLAGFGTILGSFFRLKLEPVWQRTRPEIKKRESELKSIVVFYSL